MKAVVFDLKHYRDLRELCELEAQHNRRQAAVLIPDQEREMLREAEWDVNRVDYLAALLIAVAVAGATFWWSL